MGKKQVDGWEDGIAIPFDKPEDAFSTGEFFGLMRAAEALDKLPKPQRETPGVGLAYAIINGMAMTARGNEAIRNMRLASRRGYDINTHMIAGGPDGLMVKPLDLAEQGEGA